jgi:hypothetical protein
MGDIAIAQLPWRDEVATLLMAIAIDLEVERYSRFCVSGYTVEL